jgi:predicted enzyme related to lactoylglutathione lyase
MLFVRAPTLLVHRNPAQQQDYTMINGVHALIYTKQADDVRAFFRDVLEWRTVDAGHGWLIFAMPPAELGIHPADEGMEPSHELYLMCDNVHKTLDTLRAKGVKIAREVSDQGWGRVAAIELPGGSELGIYEPRHTTAL